MHLTPSLVAGSATVKPTTGLPEIYQLLRDPATVTALRSTKPASSEYESIATSSTATAILTSYADKTAVAVSRSLISQTVTAPSSVIVQAKGHQQTDSSEIVLGACSDSAAVKQGGSETTAVYSPEPAEQLAQTDVPSDQGCAESPSKYESHCSSPDNKEVGSSTLCSSHTEEDEGEETDTYSSPSSVENVDVEARVIKKQKMS